MMELLTNDWFWIGFIGIAAQIIGAAVSWREKSLLPDTLGSLIKYITTHQLTILLSVCAYIIIELIKYSTGIIMDGYCIMDAYASQEILNRFVMKGKDYHNVDSNKKEGTR